MGTVVEFPATAVSTTEKHWTAQAVDMAREAGFFWGAGRITRNLKPHVERDGWPWVKRVWGAYLRSKQFLHWDLAAAAGTARGEPVADIRYVHPNDFNNTYGFWDQRCTPKHLLPIKKQQHLTGDLSLPPDTPRAA